MDPITGLMIGGIVSGGLQYMNSKEASEQSAQERAQMQQMIDRIRQPDFDFTKLSPAEYKVIAKLNPEVAPYIAEMAPQAVKGESRGRDVEEETLERMLNLSRGGKDPLADIERARMSRQVSGDANSSRASIDQLFQRRGAAPNSMMQYGANLSAIQDAGMREALAGEAAAANSIGRRDQMMGQAASLGGQIRAGDMDMEKYNVGNINAFNTRMAAGQNDHARYAAGERNKANVYNMENAQNVANQNVAQKNSYQMREQDRLNQLRQQQYSNELAKYGQQANNSLAAQQANFNNAAQNNQAIQGVSSGLTAAAIYANSKQK